MRNSAFCICVNKGADQLLYFRYTDSEIPLLPKSEAIVCDSTARFVSDLVGNPEDRFCNDAAHFSGGCSNSAYTHLELYSLCIMVVTDPAEWPIARSKCTADGADLLMMKDAGFKVNLQNNVLSGRYLNEPFHE